MEAVVKVTILFLLWSGKIIFSQGKVREKSGNFKVDVLCEPLLQIVCLVVYIWSVNTRLGADHHQLIMPPISKDCSNTFLSVHSFMPLHANGTN